MEVDNSNALDYLTPDLSSLVINTYKRFNKRNLGGLVWGCFSAISFVPFFEGEYGRCIGFIVSPNSVIWLRAYQIRTHL